MIMVRTSGASGSAPGGELGQLAFVGTVLVAGMGLRRFLPSLALRSTRPGVCVVGILAAYWCFERLAAWLA